MMRMNLTDSTRTTPSSLRGAGVPPASTRRPGAGRSSLVPGASCTPLLALLLLLCACVTETVPSPRGSSLRPQPRAASLPSNPKATLSTPSGPVATPATSAVTLTSRVIANIKPLGVVPYDGQVLPIPSPDARFLAVQEGEPPDWDTLLAAPGAVEPLLTRLAVYDLTASPLSRVATTFPLPAGLLLGRSADDTGFLVESPRADGSRWIGRVEWITGRLDWLVQTQDVNAHAALTAQGDLAFVRRPVGSMSSVLVLRAGDGSESVRTLPETSYDFPLTTGDSSFLFAILRGPRTLDVEAIRVLEDTPGTRRLGSSVLRRDLSRASDPSAAFQAAAPVQNALPARRGPGAGDIADQRQEDPLVFFHPAMNRMVVLDLGQAQITPLPPRTFAAARWTNPEVGGYFTSTSEGLFFTPDSALSQKDPATRRDARVLASPYVPRATTDPEKPLVIVGPTRRDPRLLEITLLAPGVQPDQPR